MQPATKAGHDQMNPPPFDLEKIKEMCRHVGSHGMFHSRQCVEKGLKANPKSQRFYESLDPWSPNLL